MDTRASRIWGAVSDTLLGRNDLSGPDVPSMAGVQSGSAHRFWQALGFPSVPDDERVFTRRDVAALRAAATLIEGDGPDREMLLQMARATGQALSRLAHMHVLSIADRIAEAAGSRDLSNSEAADRVAEIAENLVRGYEPFLGYIWRRHLLAAITQTVVGAIDRGDASEAAVGFADLVDFTAISQQLAETELAALVDRFEEVAVREIAERGGRVIKTLGDEVMFANAGPRAAADTALALVEAARDDDVLPDVRVGVAIGHMLAFEGDLYGPTVNLASRLAGIARPGTVIVSDRFARRLVGEEDFTLVDIRDVKLKGIGRTRPSVLRRRDPRG